MNLVYSNNKNDVDTCDYVKIENGTVFLVISLDKEYVCVRTVEGDVWIPRNSIMEVNPHLKY